MSERAFRLTKLQRSAPRFMTLRRSDYSRAVLVAGIE